MTKAEGGVLAAAARLVDAFSRHDTDAYFAAFARIPGISASGRHTLSPGM